MPDVNNTNPSTKSHPSNSGPNAQRKQTQRRGHPGGHPGGGPGAPPEKATDAKGTLKKLVAFIGQFKALLVLVFIFAVGSTAFNVIGPKVMSGATTVLFNGAVSSVAGTGSIDFDAIGQILLLTLIIYAASACCSFAQGWIMSSVSQKTCYKLRRDIAEKIDRLPMSYLERTSIGDTLSRITNDVDTLGQSLNQGLTQLVTSLVTIIGVIAIMFSMNWLLTLITLAILPVSAIAVSIVVKRSQKYFLAQQNTLGNINGIVEETFSGHAVVRAFNQEAATERKFCEVNEQLREAAWKSQFMSGLMQPIMTFISNLGYVAIAIVGSILAAVGTITVGDIQAFIQYVKNFTQPITQLAQVSNMLQTMLAAAERIFNFLNEDEMLPDANYALPNTTSDSVEFSHVKFGYTPEKPVINDFSAKVLPGQTIALVGATGAGKTTIVKLLMRFYDCDSGSIRIGGIDTREMPRNALREMFSMVLQDTWLFSGTIRENIRYGRMDATDEEVEEAARAAFVHHFVTTLPDGYDTIINEDASNISAGQRQLITIARAILANRSMLILDEATSNVDTRTEERIQKAMDNLMKGRTSFVIAHRLSTIRSADLILVIDKGDIVEQGTHDQLLEANGTYAELYNSQFRE